MTDPIQAPVQCPLCHALTVKPFKVAMHEPGSRRVLLRCEHCGHRWSEIEPLPPALGEPSPR